MSRKEFKLTPEITARIKQLEETCLFSTPDQSIIQIYIGTKLSQGYLRLLERSLEQSGVSAELSAKGHEVVAKLKRE